MSTQKSRLISHRGNIYGVNPETENKPESVMSVLALGYDVEIDVWNINGTYYLGHDEPTYEVSESFLRRDGLWCHAKNLTAFYTMLAEPAIHCFWNDKDDYALTSKGYIWTNYGKKATIKSIVMVGPNDPVPKLCHGICGDYVGMKHGLTSNGVLTTEGKQKGLEYIKPNGFYAYGLDESRKMGERTIGEEGIGVELVDYTKQPNQLDKVTAVIDKLIKENIKKVDDGFQYCEKCGKRSPFVCNGYYVCGDCSPIKTY